MGGTSTRSDLVARLTEIDRILRGKWRKFRNGGYSLHYIPDHSAEENPKAPVALCRAEGEVTSSKGVGMERCPQCAAGLKELQQERAALAWRMTKAGAR